MEVNSFRELVAQVINKYHSFKDEVQKAEVVLTQSKSELVNIREEVTRANDSLDEAKQQADIVKDGAKDLAKTREVVSKALAQLETLKKEYTSISKSLQSFNDLTRRLSNFDLENLIKEALKVDSQNILLFSKVVDELILSDKYQELIKALTARLNDELEKLGEIRGSLNYLKRETKDARLEVKSLINTTKVETAHILDGMQAEALKIYYKMQEATQEETERAKVAINGYVSDFYKVITELQSKVLILKVVVMDSLNNALKEYNERIEAYTQKHISKMEQEGIRVEQKFKSLEAGINAMEKLNDAIATGKKHKFRYNVFTALQYINTARITLAQNDGMLSSTLRFYHESFAKEVLEYLIKERETFNKAMQQKETEAKDAVDLMTAIREDIELKRRNSLFLSLMKG